MYRYYYHLSRAIIVCYLVVFSLLPTSSHAWEKRQTSHGKSIIAYYASWQMYDRSGLAKPSNLVHSKVTRYNFAFFQTNSKGDIWGTDGYTDSKALYGEINWNLLPGQQNTFCSWVSAGQPPLCQGHRYDTGLIYQAHKAGVEVYPSIGGWTLSNHFSALAKSLTSRQTFAANCVKLIESYDFDGIDIDWEYPGYADHMGTPEDKQNYTLLLQEIRNALDALGSKKRRVYGLTAALPCGPNHMDNIEIGAVSKILTELNLMTYDMYGTWDKKTGPNAPLYDTEGGLPGFSVHSCVENWKAGGGLPDKINIGLPFYGRSFSGSGLTKFGQANGGNADVTTWGEDEGSPQYYNIASKLSDFTSVRDEQTKTQFAYNSAGFVSYDDERAICEKTEYVIDSSLNGYIIWEISGDLMPDLSTPLLDATNNRLKKLDVRCDLVDWEHPKPAIQTIPIPKPTLNSLSTQTFLPTVNNKIESISPTHPRAVPNLVQVIETTQNSSPVAQIPTQASPPTPSVKVETTLSVSVPAHYVKPTLGPTKRATTTHSQDDNSLFYPRYNADGTSVDCRNDGNAPMWMTSNMMRSSRRECCSSYVSSSWSDRCNAESPFYPNFDTKSCVNDGNHPSWMAGDYLADNRSKCCNKFFRDKKVLEKCTSE